jgi:hypothetical protein
MFCKNCVGCNNCFGCANFKNKSYYVFNEAYTKEDYFKKLADLGITTRTKVEALREKAVEFWKKFPTEHFARLRFMELAPGGHIAPHNDSPNGIKNIEFDMMDHMIPINVPIIHPDDCYMTLESHGVVPFTEGKALIVNITNTHSFVNNSPIPRMHMIAHCIIGNKKKEFSELVVRSYNKTI